MHVSLFWSCLCGYNKVPNAVNIVIYKGEKRLIWLMITLVQINMWLVFWPESPGYVTV